MVFNREWSLYSEASHRMDFLRQACGERALGATVGGGGYFSNVQLWWLYGQGNDCVQRYLLQRHGCLVALAAQGHQPATIDVAPDDLWHLEELLLDPAKRAQRLQFEGENGQKTQLVPGVVVDDEGFMPLHLATVLCSHFSEHESVLQTLLAGCADVNAKTKHGVTPLQIACGFGSPSVAQQLINAGAVLLPIRWAKIVDKPAVVQVLLTAGADLEDPGCTNTPLFLACRSASTGAAASALLLIIAGADVNSKNFGQNTDISHSETPLHAAAEACAPSRSRPAAGVADAAPCENAADNGAVLELNEVIAALLAAGALINARNKVGQTPLHKASFMGHIGNIRQLLAASADINARTNNGRTTYDMAAERLETLALPPLPQGESEERRILRQNLNRTCDLLLAHGGLSQDSLEKSLQPQLNAVAETWRREGKICIKRFRGFGTFKSDYSLQFQSGNTFVADVMLRGGKFYLEVSVLEIDSVVQFGFFTDGFFSREPAQGGFKGVGDDAASWAVDGTRQFKCFTGAKSDFGTKWVNGDVVGLALDASNDGSFIFHASVNGSFDKPNGKAFMMAAQYCSPAFSGQRGRYCVNFGDRPFQYSPPDNAYISVFSFNSKQAAAAQ